MSDKHYSLKGINVPPEEFLRPFFDPKEKVCLRVFSDKPYSAFSGQKLECVLENFTDISDTLKRHNEQGRGIYFVINFGGHEDAHISRINAQFMECDDLPLEQQLAQIQAFPLEPSLIVKTRKSLHCYWLIKNGDVDAFRRVQRKLVAQFNADITCINESRVFRLPGFLHCKAEPVMVEVVKFNPELRYKQSELEAVLPDIPDETAEPIQPTVIRDFGTQKGLVIVGRKCQFIQYTKKNAKTLSEPLWYSMITNLAIFEGGAAAIHKLSKPYPRYSFEQTQRKIEHFHKSGTKPMTCAKIAERGFVCLKMKNGTCRRRSPAALAFDALEATELKKLLVATKAAKDPVIDIATAQRFINDFLFNVDAALAEPFIKYDIKQYFGFKNSDMKPLLQLYRDVFARFFSNQEVRRERRDKELADWYDVSDKGKLIFMPGVLADHLSENFNAFYCAEQYYYYENGVYTVRADKDARATVRTYLISRDATMNQINDAEGQWQLVIRKPIHEINPNCFIINTLSGLYNVLDDSFREHDPSYPSTVQIKANYDSKADCPRFLEFLQSVLDEPEINLLQEIFGYFLVPITKAQKSFMLVGLANTGKSTILHVVQELLLGADKAG